MFDFEYAGSETALKEADVSPYNKRTCEKGNYGKLTPLGALNLNVKFHKFSKIQSYKKFSKAYKGSQ